MPAPPKITSDDLTGAETLGGLREHGGVLQRFRTSIADVVIWAQRQRDIGPDISNAVMTYWNTHKAELKGDAGATGQQGLKGDAGASGAKGDTGPQGAQGLKGDAGAAGATGAAGAAGAPKRVERYTATTNASGVATFTFSPAFTAAPDIQVISGWTGDQMIGGGVASQSVTGCTVNVKISRATLLLSSGPFQAAGAGVAVTIRAIGN